MAEPALYVFELREVLTALIKEQGLREGVWTVGVEFNLGAVLAGPAPEMVRPSAVVSVNRLHLVRADPNTPEFLTVDAAALIAAQTTRKARGSSQK